MYNTSARISRLQKSPSTRSLMAVNRLQVALEAASIGELVERGHSCYSTQHSYWVSRCSTDTVRALQERLESFQHFISPTRPLLASTISIYQNEWPRRKPVCSEQGARAFLHLANNCKAGDGRVKATATRAQTPPPRIVDGSRLCRRQRGMSGELSKEKQRALRRLHLLKRSRRSTFP